MIWLTGDINFCDGYFDAGIGTGSLVKKGFNPLQYLPISQRDIWVGNFEGVLSDYSDLHGLAARQFLVSPKDIRHVTHPHIYAVANNHVMQHGTKAYSKMVDSLHSLGCEVVGSDTCRSVIFEHQGTKVSVTAFNQRPENFRFGTSYWSSPELVEIRGELEKIAQEAQFKIAYIHWGNEFINYPYKDQRELAHWLIDTGFDLIVGMHPHILQGFEVYKGKHIFYSLGNTVFNMAWYKTKFGALVKVDLSTPQPTIGYEYIHIDKQFSPHIVSEADVPTDCRFDQLNALINHKEENEKYYRHLFKYMKEYRKANNRQIAKNFMRMKPTDTIAILTDFVKRHF